MNGALLIMLLLLLQLLQLLFLLPTSCLVWISTPCG
jgi:hypothetical protein